MPSSMRFFCKLQHQQAGRIHRMVNSRRAHINSNFLRSSYITKKVTFIAKWRNEVSGYIHGEMVVASCSNLTFIACSKKCHHKTNDNNVVFHFFTDIFEGFLGVLGVLHPCAVLSPVSHKKMLPNCQRREW